MKTGNSKVFIRCGRNLRSAEVLIIPDLVMKGSSGTLIPGIQIGPFEMPEVDAEFIREVIAYSVNEGQVFADEIHHEPGDSFAPAPVHWSLSTPERLREQLGW